MTGTAFRKDDPSTTRPPGAGSIAVADMPVVPVRHYGRWTAATVSLILLGLMLASMTSNPNYRWDVVFDYFFSPRILEGLGNTLALTVVAMLIGVILGVIVALLRQSPNPVLSQLAGVYIWFFRGTPLFVQLLFWGYIAALYPSVSIGIPFTEIEFYGADTNTLMTPWLAAVLGLSLNESAYMAEIVRGGINSIDQGQREAGQAIGMRKAQIMKRIMLPQAMRVILPPTGNNVISMLKTTSVVSVLAFPELLYSAQLIYAVNYLTIPLLIVASIWYLIVTTILSIGQHYLEKHFEQGHRSSASGPSLLQRLSRPSERRKQHA